MNLLLFLLRTSKNTYHSRPLISLLLLTAVACSSTTVKPGHAQTTGNCLYPSAEADLDVANVRARLFTDGSFFSRPGPVVYEVPHGIPSPIGNASLWIGGKIDGEVRTSIGIYDDKELWAGPLDDQGNPPADCSIYDRIFSVYDEDIRRYNETGIATDDLRDWPWELGAPVFDKDGDPDNYDLAAGDRPYVFGDQTLWWVMNDAGNRHRTSDGEPLHLEVRITAFASQLQSLWIPNTTFYRFELVNKRQVPIDSMYFGVYAEGEPGGFFVGSDSLSGIAFLYHADGDAEVQPPPAMGFTFLRGPLVDDDGADNDNDGTIDEPEERLKLTTFLRHSHINYVTGWPRGSDEFYRYLKGLWRDGQPMTYGGCCGRWYSETPTRFMFSAIPPGFWSEENTDGRGSRNPAWFNTMLMPTGPFRLEPGEIEEIILAIVYSQGVDRFDSVRQLLGAPASLRNALPFVMKFDTAAVRVEEPPSTPTPPPETYGLGHHPNPAAEVVSFRFELPGSERARLVLYDLLGREIATLAEGLYEPGRQTVDFRTGELPAGVYLYRLETPRFVAGKSLTVVR